jgi:hypothetical protein
MDIMTTPTFLITSLLESLQGNFEELRKKLFNHGILTKDYDDDGLILLYHKYDTPICNEFERECRSLVIDRSTLKIKSYSCEMPRINKEGAEFLIANSTEQQIINPCYEGTYLSVFNHNGKWYVSTRRCLDSQESVFISNTEEKQEPKSHYEMFSEVIKNSGYDNFNEFTNKLNPEYSYYFVLVHYQNKHIIDYTNQFGPEYKRLCLTTVRNSDMTELDIYENKVDFANYENTDNIFVPPTIESYEHFSSLNKTTKYNETPELEGIVIRVWNEPMHKYNLIKLQTINYQFAQVIGSNRNIFKGLVYLYQNNDLITYFEQNPNTITIKKIVNPHNYNESYDTIGIIDAVFKVCTSELFELFKILWSIKNGKHQKGELYNLLPKEYKDIMFAIRGIYFKKKFSVAGKENVTSDDIKKSYLRLVDIYHYIKSLSTENFVAFLRMRKLMFNWINMESSNQTLADFRMVSNYCDKVHLKLCAIFTNKLFPDIMPNDIPPQKETTSD